MCKIPKFHLIFRCGNFMQTLWKGTVSNCFLLTVFLLVKYFAHCLGNKELVVLFQSVSIKFLHQEIRLNYGILCSANSNVYVVFNGNAKKIPVFSVTIFEISVSTGTLERPYYFKSFSANMTDGLSFSLFNVLLVKTLGWRWFAAPSFIPLKSPKSFLFVSHL